MERCSSLVNVFVNHCAKLAMRYTKCEAQEMIKFVSFAIKSFQMDFYYDNNRLMIVVYSDCEHNYLPDVEVELYKYQDDDDDEIPLLISPSTINKHAETITSAIMKVVNKEETYSDEEDDEEIDLSPPAPRVIKRIQLDESDDDEE